MNKTSRYVFLIAAAGLSGCSGLNVSWVATASYNTPATTQALMKPGEKQPELYTATEKLLEESDSKLAK